MLRAAFEPLTAVVAIRGAISVGFLPQGSHFFVATQEFLQRSGVVDPAVLHEDDLIGALEGRMTMRNHQAGCIPQLEQPFP